MALSPQKQYWADVREITQRLNNNSCAITPAQVNMMHNDDLVLRHWKLLTQPYRGRPSQTLINLRKLIIKAWSQNSSYPGRYMQELGLVTEEDGTIRELTATERKAKAVNAEKKAIESTFKHHPAGLQANSAVAALKQLEAEAQPDKQTQYNQAGDQLRMAIWFIKQVGDVQKAKDLLDVAAEAMNTALKKV